MSLGQILALLVLLGCFVMWVGGFGGVQPMVLLGVAALALAMLLSGVAWGNWRPS